MKKRSKPTTLQIGEISHATLREQDLIPSFLWEIEHIKLSRNERKAVHAIRSRVNAAEDDDSDYWTSDDASYDMETLTNIMDAHTPDYAYFGTLEGDGSCFGVWPNIDSLEEASQFEDDGVIKINAGDSFPKDRKFNYVMSVTDHGNVTLYRRSGNRWIEVWSVV